MSNAHDALRYRTTWKIKKYLDDAAFAAGSSYEEVDIDGNLLLNEGIGAVLDLAAGLATPTAFNNASAYLGVGDSSTAEAATQTGLQATTNKTYKAMSASYPQRSNQTVTWQAVFGGTDANYAWNEFTIANSSSDTGINLNRKVSAQGTKASGQTWTLQVSITLS